MDKISYEDFLKEYEEIINKEKSSEEYNLYKPFDIESHKKKYVHYLEVVIDIDGTIHYGVPSHEQKAISLYMKRRGLEHTDDNIETIQKEIFDSRNGIEDVTGCILVWENSMSYFKINSKQYGSLRKLKMNGLITFQIPTIEFLKDNDIWCTALNE